MFSGLKSKLRFYYYTKVKKITPNEYNIMRMRKSGIKIGERCRIYTFLQSHEPAMLEIGDDVTISGDVALITHDNSILKYLDPKTDVVGKIMIGDRCFLGNKCIVMLGVTLGENCIVGAGAVVTHSFPPHSVVAGNPARKICTTDQLAEKYKDYAIDFGVIPWEKRNQYILEHPEKWVVR